MRRKAWIWHTLFSADLGSGVIVVSFCLNPAYPNPFNSSVNIEYELNRTNDVSLSIIDLTGREITRLNEGRLTAGAYVATWDASNIPSGIYIARLSAGGSVKTTKVVCVK